MKRSPLPPRKAWLKRSQKRIPQVNPRRKAKRDRLYRRALNNSHAKAQRKMLAIRSGGICECGCGMPFTESDPMERAHVRYSRLGHELDSDVQGWRQSCNRRERALRRGRLLQEPSNGRD